MLLHDDVDGDDVAVTVMSSFVDIVVEAAEVAVAAGRGSGSRRRSRASGEEEK